MVAGSVNVIDCDRAVQLNVRQLLRVVKRRILMLFPYMHIHLAVGFPVIRRRQEGDVRAGGILRDKTLHQPLPFVKMHQQVAEATVILPTDTAFLWVSGEVERSIDFVRAHLPDLFNQFRIAFLHGGLEL